MSERVAMRVSLSAGSLAFLRRRSDQLEPYEVSPSMLLDLSVSIVQHLCAQGQLDLSPKALQDVLLLQQPAPAGPNQARRADIVRDYR
jgi:hypothetical protein